MESNSGELPVIQRTQSEMLRIIPKAEWYIRNEDIHNDLSIETVNETIKTAAKNTQINYLATKTQT